MGNSGLCDSVRNGNGPLCDLLWESGRLRIRAKNCKEGFNMAITIVSAYLLAVGIILFIICLMGAKKNNLTDDED